MSIGAGRRPVFGPVQPSRHGDVLAIGALAFVSIMLFSSTLFTDRAICCDDVQFLFFPYQHLWAETVRQGELPLWIPYLSGGRPWLADAVFSVMYPTMLLNLILPVNKAIAADLLLHVWVAAVFTYLFLRGASISRVAAFLGASVFAFGGFVIAHTTHVSLIRSIAWLPWILLLTRESTHRPWAYTVPRLSVAAALSILGGHVQMVAINFSLAAILATYTAAATGERLASKARAVVRALTILCSGGLLGSLICAIVLIPAYELVGQSVRAGGLTFKQIVTCCAGSSRPLLGISGATDYSVPPGQMLMLILPKLFGTPANGSYVGVRNYTEMPRIGSIIALILAVLGLFQARRPERWFFAIVIMLAGVLGMGHHTPVYGWLLAVNPFFRYFRVPARFLLWSSFALAVLAAYGIAWISDEQPDATGQRCWRLVRGGSIFATIVGLYAAIQGPGVVGMVRWLHGPLVSRWPFRRAVADAAIATALHDIRRAGLLLAAATLILLMVRSRWMGRNLAVGSLGLLLLGELYMFGVNFYPTTTMDVVPRIQHPPMLQNEAYRIATTQAFNVDNILRYSRVTSYSPPAQGLRELLDARIPNLGLVDRVADISYSNSVGLERVDEFLTWMWRDFEDKGGRSPLLDFFGARFIYDCRANRWYRKVEDENPCIWMNPNAIPRGWLVTRYVVVKDDQEMERTLRGIGNPSLSTPNLANTVFLNDTPRETFGLQAREDAGRIVHRMYRLTRVSFDLALTGSAILVLNDVHYPGWRAYVDGDEVPVFRANHAFRAIFLPGGARQVNFVFQPWSVRVGTIISLVALLLLVLWLKRAPFASGSRPSL